MQVWDFFLKHAALAHAIYICIQTKLQMKNIHTSEKTIPGLTALHGKNKVSQTTKSSPSDSKLQLNSQVKLLLLVMTHSRTKYHQTQTGAK